MPHQCLHRQASHQVVDKRFRLLVMGHRLCLRPLADVAPTAHSSRLLVEEVVGQSRHLVPFLSMLVANSLLSSAELPLQSQHVHQLEVQLEVPAGEYWQHCRHQQLWQLHARASWACQYCRRVEDVVVRRRTAVAGRQLALRGGQRDLVGLLVVQHSRRDRHRPACARDVAALLLPHAPSVCGLPLRVLVDAARLLPWLLHP